MKILVDGAVVTFPRRSSLRMQGLRGGQDDVPNSSGKAVLSVSNRALMIDFHFVAVSALELKKRLSLRRSKTGDRQALSAGVIFVVSRMTSTIISSWSNGLHGCQCNFDFKFSYTLRLALHSRVHNVVKNIATSSCNFVIFKQKSPEVWKRDRAKKLDNLFIG